MNPISQEFSRRRQERGWTLDDVSAKTRIRMHVLDAIEQGNFDVLPAAYIRSYLKIYSQLLGITEDELTVLWNESVPAGSDIANATQPESYTSLRYDGRQQVAQSRAQPVKISKPFIASMVYSAVALGVAVVVYYFFFRTDPSPTLALRPGELAGTTEITDDTNQKGGGMLTYFDNSFPADSIILEAQSNDTAWMTINMDGQRSQQITVFPSQQLRWAAKDYFILSMGNAGAISLKRNGQQLQKIGEKGTIVRQVKITAKDVIASSEPYKPQPDKPQPAVTKPPQSPPVKQQQTPATQSQPIQKPAQNVPVKPQQSTTKPPQTSSAKQPTSPVKQQTDNAQTLRSINPVPPTVKIPKQQAPPQTHTAAAQPQNTSATHVSGTVLKSPQAAVKAKPKLTAKQKLAQKKNAKSKQSQPPSALQRILKNTAKESGKRQRPDITPVTPVQSQPKEHKPPTPVLIPPVEKKSDEQR